MAVAGDECKVSLDGKVLGMLGEAGKQLKQFTGFTKSPAHRKTKSTSTNC